MEGVLIEFCAACGKSAFVALRITVRGSWLGHLSLGCFAGLRRFSTCNVTQCQAAVANHQPPSQGRTRQYRVCRARLAACKQQALEAFLVSSQEVWISPEALAKALVPPVWEGQEVRRVASGPCCAA
jgi:hypothetical protein